MGIIIKIHYSFSRGNGTWKDPAETEDAAPRSSQKDRLLGITESNIKHR
jgi:hypothetical protein